MITSFPHLPLTPANRCSSVLVSRRVRHERSIILSRIYDPDPKHCAIFVSAVFESKIPLSRRLTPSLTVVIIWPGSNTEL